MGKSQSAVSQLRPHYNHTPPRKRAKWGPKKVSGETDCKYLEPGGQSLPGHWPAEGPWGTFLLPPGPRVRICKEGTMTPLDLPPMRKDRQALRGIRLQPLRQMKLSPLGNRHSPGGPHLKLRGDFWHQGPLTSATAFRLKGPHLTHLTPVGRDSSFLHDPGLGLRERGTSSAVMGKPAAQTKRVASGG